MRSKKESTDARVHTAGNDSDSSAAKSSGQGWCPYAKGAPSAACACQASCWYSEGAQAEREAAARYESVDGVHSREAR
jgi:hypothetical protein